MTISTPPLEPTEQPTEWVLVPREPTEAMIASAVSSQAGKRWDPAEIYRAMLAAAPSAPTGDERGAVSSNDGVLIAEVNYAIQHYATLRHLSPAHAAISAINAQRAQSRASSGAGAVDAGAAESLLGVDDAEFGMSEHRVVRPVAAHTHSAPPALTAAEAFALCGAKAREFASHYKEGSDGRNTFIILAEWAESKDRLTS